MRSWKSFSSPFVRLLQRISRVMLCGMYQDASGLMMLLPLAHARDVVASCNARKECKGYPEKKRKVVVVHAVHRTREFLSSYSTASCRLQNGVSISNENC